MKKSYLCQFMAVLLQAILLAGITVFSVIPVSCKVSEEGISFYEGDYSSPKVESISVIDEQSIMLQFSEKVTVTSAIVSPFVEGISDSAEHSQSLEVSQSIKAAAGIYEKISVCTELCEDGKSIIFNLAKPTQTGKNYELYCVVQDEKGNSLTFVAEFTGYNSNLPQLIMTEVQPKYAKATLSKGTEYRCEFVEFLALSDGNLAGLRLQSISDGAEKAYDFPDIDVKKGEVFVVHLRTGGNEEKCKSEEGENLNLSTERFSCDGVRDLWSQNTSACLNDTCDILVLLNKSTGKIIDGFMYKNSATTEWRPELQIWAEKLVHAGIYGDGGVGNASLTDSDVTLSPTKSLQRKNAKELKDFVLNGNECFNPVAAESSTWKVNSVTPGTL